MSRGQQTLPVHQVRGLARITPRPGAKMTGISLAVLSATLLVSPASALAQAASPGAAESISPLAQQQDSTAAATTPASNVEEEIVVYATKRGAQALQDTPIAISAFNGQQLEEMAVTDLESLSYSAPNVTLDEIGAPIANFSIRGLSSNSSIPSLDPPVGTFIDGVYLGTNAGIVTDFFDVDSVEILRGPQGVLQGKNVAGGAVMIRTRRPSQDFGITGKVGVNSFPGAVAAVAVEGGLSDQVAGKIVGYFSKDGGWANNITTGEEIGDMETWFVRPALRFDGGGIDAYLVGEIGKTHGDGPIEKNLTIFENRDDPKHSVANDVTCCTSIEWKQAILELNGDVDFGDGQITSITGWRDTDTFSVTDTDAGPTRAFHLTSLALATQFSQEVRYSGTFGIWKPTVGLYYFHQDLTYFEARDFGAIRTTFGGEVETKSSAAFLNNRFDFTDQIGADIGVRYTREKKAAKIAPQGAPLSSATSSCDFDARLCKFTFSGKNTSSGVTARFALDWKPTDDILIYVSRDEGLRSGGYNVRHTSPTVTPRVTDDEEITSYEIGGKFQFLDRKVTFNVAAFLMDIDNILRDSVVFVEGVGFVQLNQNAGNARVNGVEAELVVRPVDGLRINGSVGYLDNSYRDVFLDISGDRIIDQKDFDLILPRLSRWTTSIGASYEFDLAGVGGMTFWANYAYRSRAPYPDNNLTFMPPANVVDASITWDVNEKVSVALWGKNLLNDLILTSNTFAGAAIGEIAYINPPRQFGLELRFKY